LKDYDHSCSCDDLECWRKNSSQGTKDALACAASAASAAADIATAGAASTTKRVVFAIEYAARTFDIAKNIAALASRSYNIYYDGKPTSKNMLDMIRALSTGSADVMKHFFGADYVKNPQLQCARDITSFAGSLASAAGSVISLDQAAAQSKSRGQTMTLNNFGELLKTLYAMSEGVGRFAFALNACTTVIQYPEVAADMKKLTDNFKQIAGYARVASIITFDCGLGLGHAGVVLIQNSMCLASDLGNLAESFANVDQALDNAFHTPAPNPPGDKPGYICNGEPKSCANFAAKKFGMWLYRQNYYSYATRSYLCADMCGNNGSGGNECQQYANDIFGADTPFCSPYCKTAQCDTAVANCISQCCGLEGSCVDAAQKKLKSYQL
jgi:hypothetical protein